jgi:hypothetical protein
VLGGDEIPIFSVGKGWMFSGMAHCIANFGYIVAFMFKLLIYDNMLIFISTSFIDQRTQHILLIGHVINA